MEVESQSTMYAKLAQSFMDFYFRNFDADRDNLAAIYKKDTVTIFNGKKYIGPSELLPLYKHLPVTKHHLTSISWQIFGECVIVSSSGNVDIGELKGSFTQSVTLIRDPDISDMRYYCILSECKNYEY